MCLIISLSLFFHPLSLLRLSDPLFCALVILCDFSFIELTKLCDHRFIFVINLFHEYYICIFSYTCIYIPLHGPISFMRAGIMSLFPYRCLHTCFCYNFHVYHIVRARKLLNEALCSLLHFLQWHIFRKGIANNENYQTKMD